MECLQKERVVGLRLLFTLKSAWSSVGIAEEY